MSCFKNILGNAKGISLMESIIAMGLFGAVAVIGLKQSQFMGKNMNEINLERDLLSFQSSIERLVNVPQTCESNFVGKHVPSSIPHLKNGDGEILYMATPQDIQGSPTGGSNGYGDNTQTSPEASYLDGKVKINSMKLEFIEENVVLNIQYQKLDGSSMATFNKTMDLLVDLNDSNQIESCFSLEVSLDETIQYLVAKDLCEKTYGVGTQAFNDHFHVDSDGSNASCSFDGFDNGLATQCPPGQAITSISYLPSTKEFIPTCSSPLSNGDGSALCPAGWIQSVSADGTFACKDLSSVVNTENVVINPPTQCRLMQDASSNELKLICGGS